MASAFIVCLGCGCNIDNEKGNRLIRTVSSRHVVPLWSSLLEEEISTRGRSLSVQSLVDNDGRMCRQCFNVFERASKLWESLKSNVSKVADVLIPTDAPFTSSHCCLNVPPTPKRSRLSSKSIGESPEVNVSKIGLTVNIKVISPCCFRFK